MDFLGIESTTLIVFLSALAAAGSFIAFALPLIMRSEKKERYKEVIEKKRKSLYESARADAYNPKKGSADISATQSLTAFYRLQELAGGASQKARNLMLQAGIRSQNAPLIYLGSRIVLPLLLVTIMLIVFSTTEKEISDKVAGFSILGGALVGFLLPRIMIKNMADKRQKEISLSFPDALDMMLICVQGGIGIEAAINKIADNVAENSETLAEELGILSAELGLLNDRKAAFMGFATRAGSAPVRSFATAMLQAEQYGTSVSKALRVLADESRDMRMSAAEQKAASLPPKLTVPMILFFLPVLFIVILGPAFLTTPK